MFIQIQAYSGNILVEAGSVSDPSDVQSWVDQRKSKWPDGTTTVTEDLTQFFIDAEDAAAGLRAMDVGRKCVALAYAINDKKQLSSDKLQAMFADPTLAMAERLLKNGALVTGKAALQAVDVKFFSAEEIKRVTDFIDRALAK